MFKSYLSDPPKFNIKGRCQSHLLIDGTYFSNDLCLVLYRDNDIKYTQLYRFSDKERYEQIREDLVNLSNLGIQISSITCDGHNAILKAIKQACPGVIVQRCVVHVHRMVNIWLRKRPKTEASVRLKNIINLLPMVKTYNDSLYFTNAFNEWYEHHKDFVNEKTKNEQTTRWWYKHKNLRRATTMIQKALPNLFHYLHNEQIPKSTNGLESFFGHLKDSLSIHRGLSYENRKMFVIWYLHYKNQLQE